MDLMERRRREWIDKERETNPTFAPDIESAKELLSPAEHAETVEYESLRYKAVALDARAKPFKLSVKERKRLTELHVKYRHIYYSISASKGVSDAKAPSHDQRSS